jgi:hypothetical protein
MPALVLTLKPLGEESGTRAAVGASEIAGAQGAAPEQ